MLLATIENIVGPEPRVNAKDRNPFEAIDKPKAVSEAERKINREFAAIHLKRTLNGKGKFKR